MYDTSGTESICRPVTSDYNIEARTRWLAAQVACAEQSGGRLLPARLDTASSALRRTLTHETAYAWLGTLLGIYPPAVIFGRIFRHQLSGHGRMGMIFICLAMNIVCCLVGRGMGVRLGGSAAALARRPWHEMLCGAAMLGFVWGLATGGAGGFIVFGIGAFFGAVCAIPVGVLAFTLYTLLHRLLARDGMIEAGRFWPAAYGVTGLVVALILGVAGSW